MSLLDVPKKVFSTLLFGSFLLAVGKCTNNDLEAGREVEPSLAETGQVIGETVTNFGAGTGWLYEKGSWVISKGQEINDRANPQP